MRIRTITNWAYGVTLLLTALSAIAFMMASSADGDERVALERHLALDTMSEELALRAETRSDQARLYAMRGDARHLEAFQRAENDLQQRERAIAGFGDAALTSDEQAALGDIRGHIDELDRMERAAVEMARTGNRNGAAEALFGPDHERAQTAVLEPVRRFQALVAARTGTDFRAAQASSDFWAGMVRILLTLTALVFLAVLFFVLRRRVALPLVEMSGVVKRLADQDYDVAVPFDRRRDEIGDMSQAMTVFRANGIERERLDAERRADQHVRDVILQMMHRLQACASQGELAQVVITFAPQIFPGRPGHLYVLNEGRTKVDRAGTWLEPVNEIATFPAAACWGLRRGRPHLSNVDDTDIACLHIGDAPGQTAALCVPLTAQGDTMGLLYFEAGDAPARPGDAQRLYLELVAENIGLALANLRLRERLTRMAVHDPLTGLFNRRCLDEAMARWSRDPEPVRMACLMIDIDHFKRFNDEFGHDAGDAVMQHVGQLMADFIGQDGTIYRFGGEEFAILLPDIGEAEAAGSAEHLRALIGEAPLAYRGRILGSISVSVGVADSPGGGAVATVISRADTALLAAKAKGRNRVARASMLSGPNARTGVA